MTSNSSNSGQSSLTDDSTWLGVFCVSLILATFLLWSFFLIFGSGVRASNTRATNNVQRELSTALRSGFIYLAMAIPLMYPGLNDLVPARVLDLYLWLPFWYAFVVTTYIGSWLDVACQSIKGSLCSVAAAVLLNYIMPGGAGPIADDPKFARSAFIPRDYSTIFALGFTSLYVYCLFVSNCQVGTKQYALGTWSAIIVAFMNPTLEGGEFRAVVWDWQFNVNWGGTNLCQFYVIALAVVLAGLTVPITPFRRSSVEFCSCKSQATSLLVKLAEDTLECLCRLITHFREETSKYALESTYLYIRELGSRRTAIEQLLLGASWECYGRAAHTHLQTLNRFSYMMRGFRQVLRIQLEHLRNHHETFTNTGTSEISWQLNEFVVALRDTMELIATPSQLQNGVQPPFVSGPSSPLVSEVAKTLGEGDDALVSALRQLQTEQCERGSIPTTMAFVDGLRTCHGLIFEFLNQPAAKIPSMLPNVDIDNLFPSREQHLHALRNCVSWLLALLWSLYVRGFRSGTVSSVSFIFSASLGSLFHRNINRMVGVGMGLVMANLPAVLLLTSDGNNFGAFRMPYHGLVVYLMSMLLTWTAAMYGYLATGAKWSYACLLWAGFGGTQMLSHLRVLAPSSGEAIESRSMLFDDVIDNFTGCLIVFIVDLVFAYAVLGTTPERVATLVPQCLDDIALIVDHFQGADTTPQGTKTTKTEALKALQDRIAKARFWDSEVQKEDLIWTMMEGHYKMDFVLAILAQCDDVYVAAYAIQTTLSRIGSGSESRKGAGILLGALRESFPEALDQRCRRYGRMIRTALFDGLKNDGRMFQITTLHRLKSVSPRFERQVSDATSTDASPSRTSQRHSATSAWQPFLSLLPLNPPWQSQANGHDGDVGAPISGGLMSVRVNVWALRLALRRIEVLISEHAHWASEDWRCAELRKRSVDYDVAVSEAASHCSEDHDSLHISLLGASDR